MKRIDNQDGFGALLVFVIVLIAALAGVAVWKIMTVRELRQPHPAPPGLNKGIYTPPPPPGENPTSACGTGRIIIYFKSEVPKSRQQEIIAAEKLSIWTEYGALNGYALITEKGRESAAAQSFLKYPEVEYAGTEGCPDRTNSTDNPS